MTLAEARKNLTDAVVPHLVRDGCLPEADEGINGATRALVRAMADEVGGAWLGRINLYKSDKETRVMWKWDGDLPTFGAAFVAPHYDETLVRLIRERDEAKYTGTAEDGERIEAIIRRLAEIGGECLHWT